MKTYFTNRQSVRSTSHAVSCGGDVAQFMQSAAGTSPAFSKQDGGRNGMPTSKNSRIFAPSSCCGFTILELLVSMLVLVLLVLVVSMITDATSKAVKTSGKHIDSEGQARLVFDRMANDFGKMVKRKDADCIFYSEAPAYYDPASNTTRSKKNNVALVGYRINTTTSTPVLERLGMGLTWDGVGNATSSGGPVFLTTLAGSAVPDPSTTLAGNATVDGKWGGNATSTLGTLVKGYSDGVDLDSYHVISDLVYRMEIQFLLTDGTLSNIPILSVSPSTWTSAAPIPAFFHSTAGAPGLSDDASTPSPPYAPGSRWFDTTAGKGYICTSAVKGAATWSPIGVQDISAIVVTLAVLDSNSRKMISGTISGSPLVDASPTAMPADSPLAVAPTTPVQPVAQLWMQAVNDSAAFATASGIPTAAASQVRIYQRTFYLSTP